MGIWKLDVKMRTFPTRNATFNRTFLGARKMDRKQKQYIKNRIKLVFSEYREFIYKRRGSLFSEEYCNAYETEKALLAERFADPNYVENEKDSGIDEPAYASSAIYDAMGFAFNNIDKMRYASYVLKMHGGSVRKWYVVKLGELKADMEFLSERLKAM